MIDVGLDEVGYLGEYVFEIIEIDNYRGISHYERYTITITQPIIVDDEGEVEPEPVSNST